MRKRHAVGYGNTPVRGGVDVPTTPPHPLDRACCLKWWRLHRNFVVMLKVADVFGFGGNPRLMIMFTRHMDQGALHLGAQQQCPCRGADVAAAPYPEAVRELMTLAASRPCPPGVNELDHLNRLARDVAARRGIEIPSDGNG